MLYYTRSTQEVNIKSLNYRNIGKIVTLSTVLLCGIPKPIALEIKWVQWPNGKPLELDGKPLTLRFMDFGGQQIMHSMHRCFLTNHTIYVVVCESRDDAEIDSVAARWMETVRSFAPECPVILALNKSDLNPHVTVNERALKAINIEYRHMIHTSAKREGDPGVQQLTNSILGEVPGCLPKNNGNKAFLDLQKELEDMEADYIRPDDFQKMCERLDIKESIRAGLMEWFQELGVAYTYDVNFQKVYVLNPVWLTNGIYRLILRTPKGGFLRHSEILGTLRTPHPRDINPDKTYTEQEMGFILHVMRKFEISLRVTQDYEEDGEEMIPMKMDKTPPERYDEFQKDQKDGALHLRWEAGYLPNNLVHRLIIRKYPELDIKCVWRTGGWFRSTDGGCEALVEMTDRAMDVYVRGKHDARIYMDSFRSEILRILDDLNIRAKEYVFCTMDAAAGKVSYKAALSHYRLGKKEMYVEDLDKFVSPQAILHENYVDTGVETRDFFISYNNGHDGIRARWIADVLRENGYTVYFQEYDCTPGMSFPQWMADAITHSRGFLAVWSSTYEESEYCRMELDAATVRKNKNRGYPLLPVRVEDVPVKNPLFQPVVRIDVLTGDEADRKKLLDAVKSLLSGRV